MCTTLPSLSCKSKLSLHTSAPSPSFQKFILSLLPDKLLPLGVKLKLISILILQIQCLQSPAHAPLVP